MAGLKDDHVVRPGDDFGGVLAENSPNLGAALAGYFSQFAAVEGGHQFDLVVHEHDRALLEDPSHADNAPGQQTSFLQNGRQCPLVHSDAALGVGIFDPALPVSHGLGCLEERAHIIAPAYPADNPLMAPLGENYGATCVAGNAHRLEFAFHAPGGKATPPPPGRLKMFLPELLHITYAFGARIDAGVTVMEPINITQKNEQIGIYFTGHQGRQLVIVAETLAPAFALAPASEPTTDRTDFRGADAVVLVENGNSAQLQKFLDRCLEIVEGFSLVELIPGEENLRNYQATTQEGAPISLHEQGLPDRGTGLLHGNALALLLQPQNHGAHADRPRADNEHLPTLLNERLHLSCQPVQEVLINPVPGTNCFRTDFYDNASGRSYPINFPPLQKSLTRSGLGLGIVYLECFTTVFHAIQGLYNLISLA